MSIQFLIHVTSDLLLTEHLPGSDSLVYNIFEIEGLAREKTGAFANVIAYEFIAI